MKKQIKDDFSADIYCHEDMATATRVSQLSKLVLAGYHVQSPKDSAPKDLQDCGGKLPEMHPNQAGFID